ncbi:unnamed protein product [Heligmosomoides polygyrus]|uniref:G protein-coupled receptor n=1 Tax=Heligmosomoides polygyrus TaxID=6339 RepID=A0A3P8BFD8_HELPZ|nr:unnamed protein product [Heligmosomoides polygyrus]
MGHNQSVSAKDLINVNSPYSPYKEPIFEGSQRVVAYLILLSVSTLSLAAQSVFLLGVRNLCGFEANFSFSILACFSLCGVQHTLAVLAATTLAMFDLQYSEHFFLWQTIGALAFAPLFCLPYLHMLLALQRVVVIVTPTCGSSLCHSMMWKVAVMVALEVAFFVAWECIPLDGAAGVLVKDCSNLIYPVAIVLPYLLLNRNCSRLPVLSCSGGGRAAIRPRPLNDPPPYRLTMVSVDIENGHVDMTRHQENLVRSK